MHVRCSTRLPMGYSGAYWTTSGPLFGTLFHYYGSE